MSARKVLIGQTFGDYTVIKLDSIRNNERAIWEVNCETCGFSKYSSGSQLLNGLTSKCAVCAANKVVGLTMEQIDEIEVLYMLDNIKAADIAITYKVHRHIIYNLRKRFEWGDFRKLPLLNLVQRRPFRNKIKTKAK